MSSARYVHLQDQRMWLGYFELFPDYLTQGETLAVLDDNLRDLYRGLTSGEIPGIRRAAETAGCSLFGTVGITTGIAILRRAYLCRYPGTERSTSSSQVATGGKEGRASAGFWTAGEGRGTGWLRGLQRRRAGLLGRICSELNIDATHDRGVGS